MIRDTLYDTNNPLFRSIFGDTDKILPPELQNSSPACLEALGRIGLNRQINCETYIICAREIESQIQQEIFSINVVKERAKNLVRYLYEHIDALNINRGQWDKISSFHRTIILGSIFGFLKIIFPFSLRAQ